MAVMGGERLMYDDSDTDWMRQRGGVVSALDSQSGSPGFIVPLWPLAGSSSVLGCLEFKSSATVVNSQVWLPRTSWGF